MRSTRWNASTSLDAAKPPALILMVISLASVVSAFVDSQSPRKFYHMKRSRIRNPCSGSIRMSAESPTGASGNATVVDTESGVQTRSSNRKPAFPKSAYHLATDEERLKYNFMSFIDYTTSPYSQVTRLVEPRSYARSDQFEKSMADVPPTIDDVAPPRSLYTSLGTFLAWNKLPARVVVGTAAYLSFPFVVQCLEFATQNVRDDALVLLVNTFLPGVSIVLGTYFSLTLSILYDRFTRMQETVSLEASLLAVTFQNLLDLFRDDDNAAVEGAQCIADQIRTLVRESRGREIMGVVYSDPYARILQLVNERDARDKLDSPLLSQVRGSVGELFKVRSKRMADEALALAPTHYEVMTFLSGLLLLCFALGAVETSQMDGVPDEIARILFSALVVCYVILYEMSFDLNRPFDGVYQIRRSGAAMHFLEVKHSISNHPVVRGLVDFEEVSPNEQELALREECDADSRRAKAKTWYN